ncbi:MAG TPA: zf-HC2 domain-containing protein [Candidatus Acidoferrales bacterium]
MDCKTVAHNLCAFLDGQLNPAEARALNGHLRACWMCRAVAELARRTLAQIG